MNGFVTFISNLLGAGKGNASSSSSLPEEKDNKISLFEQKDKSSEKELDLSHNVNGQLDEPVYQGEYADCWLLSGILSMSYMESGAKVIEESISANEDGSVDLYFEGINKEYTVTAEEIAKENKEVSQYSKYSRGDDDALAIELGIEKAIADSDEPTNYSVKTGGNAYYLYQLYGADKLNITNTEGGISKAFSYYEKNSDNCAMALSVVDESVCGLKKDHGYAIKEVTKSSVVVVDPWNSEKELMVSRYSLLRNTDNLSVVYAEFATD